MAKSELLPFSGIGHQNGKQRVVERGLAVQACELLLRKTESNGGNFRQAVSDGL
jgi:hypothetical protein